VFSEPETRNVRYLLDTYSNIRYMIDIHSYSKKILYSWGDDDNQSTDTAMNFANPIYDGLRGNVDDSIYLEFIPRGDLDWYISVGNRIKDAIKSVRGTIYEVEPSAGLYPTSGASDDYAYCRHFVDRSKRKVLAYTIETGKEFQPPFTEADNFIAEISAGLIEFCMSCLCVVEETTRGTTLSDRNVEIRRFRDDDMTFIEKGKKYIRMMEDNSAEILTVLEENEQLQKEAVDVLEQVLKIVDTRYQKNPRVIDDLTIKTVETFFEKISVKGSEKLKDALNTLKSDLRQMHNKTVLEAIS